MLILPMLPIMISPSVFQPQVLPRNLYRTIGCVGCGLETFKRMNSLTNVFLAMHLYKVRDLFLYTTMESINMCCVGGIFKL